MALAEGIAVRRTAMRATPLWALRINILSIITGLDPVIPLRDAVPF